MNESVRKSLQTINKNLSYVKKSCDEDKIEKAKEGDKRTIFGKPSTFSGGEWHADEGGATHGEEQAQFVSPTPGPRTERDEDPLSDLETMHQYIQEQHASGKISTEEAKQAVDELYGKPSTSADSPGDDSGEWKSDMLEMGLSEQQADYMIESKKLIDSGEAKDIDDLETKLGYGIVDNAMLRDTFEDDFKVEESMNNPVQKAINTIHKNLAGVHDALQRTGATTTNDDHSHSYQIDRDGNGATTGLIGEYGVQHVHEIKNFDVADSQNHTHYI